ncbi:hypothetical protein [Clostridium botulinum]|uniref:hypothetical protein n=1 Tax=Clostridium botulinum TaxID=1491 RepID=UPI001C9B127F|nr:hypothetical protein [Clostridium botulinum]MBY6842666.1 hypothetical protein [Clostridium botulinum]
MKLWEVLKEEYLQRYVRMVNMKQFDYEANMEYYIISKNGKGRIGLFTSDGYQDAFLPSDMVEMEFELIDKKEIIPKYSIGESVRTNYYVKNMKNAQMGEIIVTQEHCDIARDKNRRFLTILDVAEGWLYEPIYKVKENDLIWSESMLDKIS